MLIESLLTHGYPEQDVDKVTVATNVDMADLAMDEEVNEEIKEDIAKREKPAVEEIETGAAGDVLMAPQKDKDV